LAKDEEPQINDADDNEHKPDGFPDASLSIIRFHESPVRMKAT
jgi:hypothetical protein